MECNLPTLYLQLYTNLQTVLELVEFVQKFGISLGGFELRELRHDGIRRAEEAALVGLLEHACVIEGVARGKHLEVEFLQVFHDFRLLVAHAQVVTLDHVVFDHEIVTENRREAEILHDGVGEFLERVREDNHLGFVAEFVHKIASAVEQAEVRNHVLDVRKLDVFAFENLDAPFHEHVVVGNVASGEAEVFDACLFGDGNPDFWSKNAFQVKSDNTLLSKHDCRFQVLGVRF